MTAVYLYIRNNNVENRITLKFSVAKKIKEQNICCKFAMRKKKKKKNFKLERLSIHPDTPKSKLASTLFYLFSFVGNSQASTYRHTDRRRVDFPTLIQGRATQVTTQPHTTL